MEMMRYLATFQLTDGKYSYSTSNDIDDCMKFLLHCINGNSGYNKAFVFDMAEQKGIVSFREVM